jgi:ADP-L-glycero-D-manno-heptose 6-epimerase
MIVITGGAGFIGSNLAAGLEARGYSNLVLCDRLGSGDKWRNVAGREVRDIVFPENLMHYLDTHAAEIDVVFHMGAISSTTEKDADLIVSTNFNLSRDLWKWCARHDVRFIYASSAATYGDGAAGFVDGETPDELSRLKPLNPYGWSKNLFDRRISRVVHGEDNKHEEPVPRQWAGLKFFNVYGPNEYHKGDMMSVICKLYPQVVAGATAKLFKSHHPDYEDGGQSRDFVYAGDCVSVMLWLYDNPQINGLFNVGTGRARSFRDLAEATFAAAGVKSKISYVDMPMHLREKYQYFTQADMGKLRAAGYTAPFTELEEGIERYVKDFMARENVYR